MFYCLLPLLVNFLLLLHTAVATPYFRPWLEIRQTPTSGAAVGLIYPPNNDASTCPNNPVNLFQDASLIASSQKKKKRSLHDDFNIAVSNPKGQHARRALTNGSCQTVARLGFEDWEASYGVNTPTIQLEGGHTYTFSIAANVLISEIQCWTKKPNSGDFSRLSAQSYNNQANATLVTVIKSPIAVHWYIKFNFGHPRGNIAVFSDKPPTLTTTGQWAPGTLSGSGQTITTTQLKERKKKKRRRRKRAEKRWWSWLF